MRLRVGLLRSTSFSPARLFAAGEVGVWYDPSDVANLDWRRNLLEWTEQFDNAVWLKDNATVTANFAIAPDGTTTAEKLIESAGVNRGRARQLVSTAVGNTLSVYAKAAEWNRVSIGISNAGGLWGVATFNLSTGLVDGGATYGGVSVDTPIITSVGNGWYRCSVRVAAGTDPPIIMPFNQSGDPVNPSPALLGDGTSGILIWGAQLETGSTATAYQPITIVDAGTIERFPNATLYRDTAGTSPVTTPSQTVALLLDKSKGLVRGPELFTNGDFSSATGWTQGIGWSIGSGVATATATSGYLYQTVASVASGKYYEFTVTISSYTSGTLKFFAGAAAAVSNEMSASGTYTLRVAANSANQLGVVGTAFTGTIDNISVREIPGNHATQGIFTSRPTYGIVPYTGRRNLRTFTEQLDNAAWAKSGVTISADTATAPDSTSTADKLVEAAAAGTHVVSQTSTLTAAAYVYSIYLKKAERNWAYVLLNAQGAYFNLNTGVVGNVDAGVTAAIQSVGDGWFRCSVSVTATAASWSTSLRVATANGTSIYTGDGTSGILAWGAQLELGSTATAYQRVITQYDVTEAGVQSLSYLDFDGGDDFMLTGTITPGVDKAQVFAGVRKVNDTARDTVAEYTASAAANNGAWHLTAPNAASATFAFESKGTLLTDAVATGFAAPTTRVLTGLGDISGDSTIIRVNNVQQAINTGDQGTGNYANSVLYIGRRGGTSLPLSGQIYSLITRFSATNMDAANITNTETWLNGKTGAY